jgi:hypothetical protein
LYKQHLLLLCVGLLSILAWLRYCGSTWLGSLESVAPAAELAGISGALLTVLQATHSRIRAC